MSPLAPAAVEGLSLLVLLLLALPPLLVFCVLPLLLLKLITEKETFWDSAKKKSCYVMLFCGGVCFSKVRVFFANESSHELRRCN